MLALKKQKGITFIGLVSGLSFVAILLMLGMRIVPMYLESFSIRSTLVSLNDVKSVNITSEKDIRQLVERRFGINNITVIKATDVIIKRVGDNKYTVTADYEIRTAIIGNLSAVASFHESTEINR